MQWLVLIVPQRTIQNYMLNNMVVNMNMNTKIDAATNWRAMELFRFIIMLVKVNMGIYSFSICAVELSTGNNTATRLEYAYQNAYLCPTRFRFYPVPVATPTLHAALAFFAQNLKKKHFYPIQVFLFVEEVVDHCTCNPGNVASCPVIQCPAMDTAKCCRYVLHRLYLDGSLAH